MTDIEDNAHLARRLVLNPFFSSLHLFSIFELLFPYFPFTSSPLPSPPYPSPHRSSPPLFDRSSQKHLAQTACPRPPLQEIIIKQSQMSMPQKKDLGTSTMKEMKRCLLCFVIILHTHYLILSCNTFVVLLLHAFNFFIFTFYHLRSTAIFHSKTVSCIPSLFFYLVITLSPSPISITIPIPVHTFNLTILSTHSLIHHFTSSSLLMFLLSP